MKTKLQVPSIFTLLDLTDHQLVFVELLARIHRYFGVNSTYRFYASDIRFLLNPNRNISNTGLEVLLKPYNDLIIGTEIDNETWYITPNYSYRSELSEAEIEDDGAIKAYWYLLGRTVGEKFEDENSNTFDKYLVAGRHGKVYGCIGGLLDYNQKRELN